MADVLDGVARGEIARVDDVGYMRDRRSDGEDRHGDHRGVSEPVAPVHRQDAEDPERQVGEGNLELERIARRPSDRVGDLVGKEGVREEPTDPAARHAHRQHVEHEHLEPLGPMLDPLVEPDVRRRQQERQDAEEKDTRGGDAQLRDYPGAAPLCLG